MTYKELSIEEKKKIVFEKGNKHMCIACPVCNFKTSLNVKVDKNGDPVKESERGIVHKNIDGVWQKRFSGPDDSYLPVHAYYYGGKLGTYTKIDESMSLPVLRRVDQPLYNDFKKALERSLFAFRF